jgi:hypothetical protein
VVVGVGDDDLLFKAGAKSVRRIELSEFVAAFAEHFPDLDVVAGINSLHFFNVLVVLTVVRTCRKTN